MGYPYSLAKTGHFEIQIRPLGIKPGQHPAGLWEQKRNLGHYLKVGWRPTGAVVWPLMTASGQQRRRRSGRASGGCIEAVHIWSLASTEGPRDTLATVPVVTP